MDTSSNPSVTLCIINYNGLEHLKSAFAAIDSLPDKFDEILVVDNASTDGSLAFLRERNDVRLVALPANKGPGGARNIGFRDARNDLILFQDNDVSMTTGTSELLSQALIKDPQALLVAPGVVYRSTPGTVQYESADCHFLGMMSPRNANKSLSRIRPTLSRSTSLVTCCFLIDRSRWEGGFLFDEGLVFNLEDHDLGIRANMLGFNTLVQSNAVVIHGSGTEGLSYRPGQTVSTTRVFCLVRNRWWIIWRYYSTRTLIILAPILLLFELFQFCGLTVKGNMREWGRAVKSTLDHRRDLAEARRHFQNRRVRPDRDVLRGGPLPLTVALTSTWFLQLAVWFFDVIVGWYWSIAKKLL